MQVEQLRAELRAARREFREARSHWRVALIELATLPARVPTIALVPLLVLRHGVIQHNTE